MQTTKTTDELLLEIETLKKQIAWNHEVINFLEKEVSNLENEVNELNEQLEGSITSDEFNTIRTTDSIKWVAYNMQDFDVMQSLAEAYTKLSPYQIVERLKV